MRLGEGVSPFPIRVENETVLYYTGMGGIFRASSTDGLNFGAPTLLIDMGSNTAMIRLENGGWRMIYNPMFPPAPGEKHPASQYFLSAVSQDGLAWTKEDGVRFRSQGAPDYDAISVPCIADLGDGRLRMYYVGDMYGPEFMREPSNNIRSAVSTDEGLTWVREDGFRITATSMDPAIRKVEDGWRLYYTAPPEDKEFGDMRVWAAFSEDGLAFGEPEIVLTPPNAGDRYMDPEFIEANGGLRMYVSLAHGEGASEVTKIVSAFKQG